MTGLRLCALMLCFLVTAACGPTKVTSDSSPYVDRYHLRTLAVLPFDVLRSPQITAENAMTLPAPKSAKASDISVGIPRDSHGAPRALSERVPPQAAELVTRLLWDRLGSRDGLSVVPLEQARIAAFEGGREAAGGEWTPETAVQVGKKLGVDGVVIGKVNVFQERVGSRIGAESAAVGFEVSLISLDGRTLWTGNYYEKQRPMTEDLVGFFQRKGAFVTAAELAAYGADNVLDTFPYGKRQ